MPISKARLKISDYNEKRKSNLRQTERKVRMVSLSLTSMVDMFAILVIFLLANSGTIVESLKVGHGINLPKAKSSDVPPRAATIQIARDAVYLDDKAVMATGQVLQTQAPLQRLLAGGASKSKGYINIVAHDRLPFGLVKRVIQACQDAGYRNVNLAVQPKGGA